MITVICPTLNEGDYIEHVIKFFIEALPVDKELLVVDGGSIDATLNIVQKFSANYKNQIEDTFILLKVLRQEQKCKLLDTRERMQRKKEVRQIFKDANVNISDSLMNLLLPFSYTPLLKFL